MSGTGYKNRIDALIERELAAQKDQLFLWAPLAFGCGIAAYFSLKAEPSLTGGAVTAAVALGLLMITGIRRRRAYDCKISYALWLLTLFMFLSAAGFLSAQTRTAFLHTVMLEKPLGPVIVEGTVVDINALEESRGAQIVLKDLTIERLSAEATPQRVRLKIRTQGAVFPGSGERIRVLARLTPPPPPAAPHAFDFQRYAWFMRIGAFGFAYKTPEILAAAPTQGVRFHERLESLRQAIRIRMERHIAHPEAAIALSLVAEERGGISESDWQAMRAAGLAHMLSISGLHISLVAGIIFFCTRFLMAAIPPLALRHPIKKYAAFAAFAAALGYTLLAGASVPAVRSLIMTGVVLLAVVMDRVAISPRLVAAAALLILICEPEALTSASFQMSFAAVAALVIAYDDLRPYLSRLYSDAGLLRRGFLYGLGICLTSVIATLATAPFSAYHFQNLALYGLIGNLLTMPVMSFIVMPAAVLSCFLMPLGLESWPLTVMGAGVGLIRDIAYGVQTLPHSLIAIPAWPPAALALFVISGLMMLLLRGQMRWLFILPLAAAFLSVSLYRQPDILVSSDAGLIALKDESGNYMLSSRRHGKFESENWLRRNGQEEIKGEAKAQKWPAEGTVMPGMNCGEEGCRLSRGDRKIAFSFLPAAQREDCRWADILIARDPVRVRNCRAVLVIDRFSVWRNGVYAVWFDGRYETVQGVRGDRPWTISNRR